MTSLRRRSPAAARVVAVLAATLASALALPACGGGGGGGAAGPDFQVTFGQSPLAATAVAGAPGQVATVRVTLSPPPPASASVQVAQTGTDFDLLGLDVADAGGGVFDVTLPLSATLAAGSRTGTISFRVCPDVACAAPFRLSSSALPYVLTVEASVGLVRYEIPQVFGTAWDDETIRTGTLLFSLTPAPLAEPTVLVVDGGGLFATGPALISPQPDGSYAADLPYPDSVAAGAYSGDVTVRICEDAACTRPFTLPQATVPYDVTIHHVETGLPPLTASFLLDGAAVADAVEGLNPEGERTYTVAAHVGQLLEITLTERPILTRRLITGATATLTREAGTYPPARYRVTSIEPGLTSGTGFLSFRVADGRWLRLTVNATP